MGEVIGRSPTREGRLSPPTQITPSHDLSTFDCGRVELSDWLRERALDSEREFFARTIVVAVGTAVVGYYCICAGSVARIEAPGQVRRNAPEQIPVVLIGRLAVDVDWQGRGLGEDLLLDAYHRTLQVSEIVGIRTILVHALDEDAAKFWRRMEFLPYSNDSLTFFQPLKNVIKALR